MKLAYSFRRVVLALAVVAAMLTAPAFAQDPRPVVLNPTIALTPGEHARLQAIADKGIDALRRYVWRTRMIHNYRLVDLV